MPETYQALRDFARDNPVRIRFLAGPPEPLWSEHRLPPSNLARITDSILALNVADRPGIACLRVAKSRTVNAWSYDRNVGFGRTPDRAVSYDAGFFHWPDRFRRPPRFTTSRGRPAYRVRVIPKGWPPAYDPTTQPFDEPFRHVDV